jgi:hypothetical protein
MSIDPMNMPILGDLGPVNPPRPVRIASALLLGNVALAVGYRLYTETPFDAVFAGPLILAVWFALGVRAGRAWARAAATVLSCLAVMVTLGVLAYSIIEEGHRWWGTDTAVSLVVMALSVGTLVASVHLMWRTDVGEYFPARVDSRAI